ncbi:Zinc-type alcohol dehydrogenase-like protein [Sparassis crispa]|uniref:Zinc-type alcohol dehydrogenase-like protein n=1 Tax=Sparassis crispa TaxID=139825 RepID=A0A401H4N1_9APHY|nr:Zinc-type alcohol dehydrogenase-like protein [Sparassis crispa]GBE89406.1 Zinc-type alcohol dehydrogenase-like protein [Sparassis crispa]
MSTAVPATMKALLVQEGKKVAVKEVPVPTVGDDDILVKNVAVAQNPTDWKYVDFIRNAGTILGCDWSGYVVAVGKNVTSPKIGDQVAGFLQGGTYTDSGAYAEYVRTPAELSWVVPEGTISCEEAATLGCAFWTAVQALYEPSRLGLVEPPRKVEREEWIFISSGSSSVGQYAIQLAHLSGYKVATTSSPHNFELVKSLGADVVFDYHGPSAVSQIKNATGDQIRHAFDTICTKETQELCARALAPGGGKIILVLSPIPEAKVRDDVEVLPTLIYTSLGRTFTLGGVSYPPSHTDRAHMAAFLKKVPALVAQGQITPNRIHRWEGGLESISDGLQYMRKGKVSAEKIVYTL